MTTTTTTTAGDPPLIHYKKPGSSSGELTACLLGSEFWRETPEGVTCPACAKLVNGTDEDVRAKRSSKAAVAVVMDRVFDECRGIRGAGQAEYAHRDENAFANFERVAERLGMKREAVLMVYAEKHLDGIHSWIQGHKSQRESVKGRINDVIVYLVLLRAMAESSEGA